VVGKWVLLSAWCNVSIEDTAGMPPTVIDIFENCLGCKWTLHILHQVRSGTTRPGQLERSAEELSRKVMNERLGRLVEFGILDKTSDGSQVVEYRLTEFGERIAQILEDVEQLRRDVVAGLIRFRTSRS
jgi:DNA-binding HxlR family transcriptional regulator